MDLHQMEYFIAVCDYGGVTPAAEALFLTPQALSKSVRRLEEELTAPLFDREKSGLVLTPFGEKALGEIRHLVGAHRAAQLRLSQIAAQEKGLIRLACAFGIPNAFPLEELRTELAGRGITLDIMEMPDLLSEEMVCREVVDMGLTVGPPQDPQLCQATLLRRFQLCAVINARHPLARKKVLSIRDLEGEQIMTKSPYFKAYRTLEEEAARQGVRLSYALRSPNQIRFLQMLESNQGIGVGITFMRDPSLRVLRDSRILPFAEDLPWEIYLTIRKGHYLSPAAQRLAERLRGWRSLED